jgi:hypothetical protein
MSMSPSSTTTRGTRVALAIAGLVSLLFTPTVRQVRASDSPLAHGPTWAECVEPGSVCTEWREAAYVFLGEIVDVEWDPETHSPRWPSSQRVTFRIAEAFKGVISQTLTITLAIGGESGPVTRGHRMLVYAQPAGRANLWVISCSRSRDADARDGEVAALRALSRNLQGTAVEGSLQLPSTEPAIPLDLRSVSVIARLGGRVIMTRPTVSQGRYVVWLPPGKYDLTVVSNGWSGSAVRVTVPSGVSCMSAPPINVRRRTGPEFPHVDNRESR